MTIPICFHVSSTRTIQWVEPKLLGMVLNLHILLQKLTIAHEMEEAFIMIHIYMQSPSTRTLQWVALPQRMGMVIVAAPTRVSMHFVVAV